METRFCGRALTRPVAPVLRLEAARSAENLLHLGSVPLQDGEKGARLLEELMGEGFAGVMIGTQPYGNHGCHDALELDPFWAAAFGLGAVVFIHPMYGCRDDRLLDYDMINAVDHGLDTSTAVAPMLFAGHFTKYTGMSVVLPHGGGALPSAAWRWRAALGDRAPVTQCRNASGAIR